MNERRRTPRVEVLGRLHGHMVSLDAAVTVREVSLGGLSFSSPLWFPIGAVHEFRLTLGDGSTVVLHARIIRTVETVAEDGSRLYITGVQFIEDDPPEDPPPIGSLIDKMT